MHRVVELELWSQPGTAPLDHSGKDVASQCCAQLHLDPTVVLGLSFIPDATDVSNLQLSLQSGEVSEPDFLAFCRANGLPEDATHEPSAASFLAQAFGQPLAWLHIPSSTAGKAMYLSIAAWASTRKLVVVEPLAEVCCLIGEPSAAHYWHVVA